MPGQAKKLNNAKAAEEARKAHHFHVLTSAQLWEAARAAQATAKALTLQYARPAAMKLGLTVYGRVQARNKTILDMITEVTVDPAKLIVIALGRNYKGHLLALVIGGLPPSARLCWMFRSATSWWC
jgi:hypothetical protein